jgi:hypothetical protein
VVIVSAFDWPTRNHAVGLAERPTEARRPARLRASRSQPADPFRPAKVQGLLPPLPDLMVMGREPCSRAC